MIAKIPLEGERFAWIRVEDVQAVIQKRVGKHDRAVIHFRNGAMGSLSFEDPGFAVSSAIGSSLGSIDFMRLVGPGA